MKYGWTVNVAYPNSRAARSALTAFYGSDYSVVFPVRGNRLVGKMNYFYLTSGEMPRVGRFASAPSGLRYGEFDLMRRSGVWVDVSLVDDATGYAAYLRARQVLSFAGDYALPFFVDAIWQLGEDWGNPRLTTMDKVYRAGIAGGVGVAFSVVLGALFPEISVPAFLLISIGVGMTAENWTRNLLIEQAVPERPLNLQPLDGG